MVILLLCVDDDDAVIISILHILFAYHIQCTIFHFKSLCLTFLCVFLILHNNDSIKNPIVIISFKFVAIYLWIFNLNSKIKSIKQHKKHK